MSIAVADSKMCTECLETKPFSEFHRNATLPDGRHCECKDCARLTRDGSRVSTHSYGGYTQGCRCDICRDAKAAYMRKRRRAASLNPASGPVEGIKHGTLFGYQERGCRCDDCVEAKRNDGRCRYRRAS